MARDSSDRLRGWGFDPLLHLQRGAWGATLTDPQRGLVCVNKRVQDTLRDQKKEYTRRGSFNYIGLDMCKGVFHSKF